MTLAGKFTVRQINQVCARVRVGDRRQMRTFSEYIGDIMLNAAERRNSYPEPPLPRDELTPGGSYTQLDLLDALPPKARVDRYGAMMSSDFLACETVKARAIRALPVHVMRKGERGPERADDHPFNKILQRPNALMSWGDFVSWGQLRRDVFGTAYGKFYRDAYGRIVELRPVIAPVKISFDKKSGVAVYTGRADFFNEPWECREDDLLILKTDVSEDGGKTGKSIAEMCADDIGLSIDLVRFYRALLDNGNHFQGYLETDKDLTQNDLVAIQNSLKSTQGAENAGKIRIFDRGLKYKAVQANLEHMDIVDQERWVLEKVCRATHVDMHHVHADAGAAASAAQGADLDFAKGTVLPEVTAWEEAFQIALDRAASLGGKPSEYYIKFNMAGLERADIKTRYEAYRIGVYAGILTRSRVCELEDEQWRPGQDRLLQPTAYYVLDEKGNPYVPDAKTIGTSGQSDGVSGIDTKAVNDSLRLFVDDARERIGKRAAADGDTPKTRQFASDVMKPIAYAAHLCGIDLDLEAEISEEIERSAGNGR